MKRLQTLFKTAGTGYLECFNDTARTTKIAIIQFSSLFINLLSSTGRGLLQSRQAYKGTNKQTNKQEETTPVNVT
jgi:hypothetical protein